MLISGTVHCTSWNKSTSWCAIGLIWSLFTVLFATCFGLLSAIISGVIHMKGDMNCCWLYVRIVQLERRVPPHPGRQQAAPSVHYTTSYKHSLVLLRMGEIIAQNIVELIEIIDKIIIVASSWLFVILYQWCTVTQTSNSFCKGKGKAFPLQARRVPGS